MIIGCTKELKSCEYRVDLMPLSLLEYVSRGHIVFTKKGAIIDNSIDRRWCCGVSHVTIHDNPIFIIDDILHYFVRNMSGVVSYTSTIDFTNTTTKHGLIIAKSGLKKYNVLPNCIRTSINTFLVSV